MEKKTTQHKVFECATRKRERERRERERERERESKLFQKSVMKK